MILMNTTFHAHLDTSLPIFRPASQQEPVKSRLVDHLQSVDMPGPTFLMSIKRLSLPASATSFMDRALVMEKLALTSNHQHRLQAWNLGSSQARNLLQSNLD